MDDRLNRHIQDTLNVLNLVPSEAEYLKISMMMVYKFGQRDQMEEDHENEMKRVEETFKK